MAGLWRRGHLRAPDGRDRRQDIRIPTEGRASVMVAEESIVVRVLNVSRGGLRIASGVEFAPGSVVRVAVGDTSMLAEVRYSTPVEGAYQAGLQIRSLA